MVQGGYDFALNSAGTREILQNKPNVDPIQTCRSASARHY